MVKRQVWKPENPNLPCSGKNSKKKNTIENPSLSKFHKESTSIKIRKSFKHASLHKRRFYMMFYHFCPILTSGLACRYTWSATSPAAKKPGTEVLVPCTWIYPVLKTSRKEPLDPDFLTSMIYCNWYNDDNLGLHLVHLKIDLSDLSYFCHLKLNLFILRDGCKFGRTIQNNACPSSCLDPSA